MYDDKTWGKASDYAAATAAGKKAVGVVCNVNNDDGSVKIVNLKDLTFKTTNGIENGQFVGNFDADNPYGYTFKSMHTTTKDNAYITDVAGIENYQDIKLYSAFAGAQAFSIDDVNNTFPQSEAGEWQKQFDTILGEYDNLVKDSSYQGINLLTGGKLTTVFNENRSHNFTVNGENMASGALGLAGAEWKTQSDIAESLHRIADAMDRIRSFNEQLGNNYSVLQTRHNFTEALADVLETGADNLVLADMNEASAEYLTLQTRQQLAVNSLSLAAESSRSVLSLF